MADLSKVGCTVDQQTTEYNFVQVPVSSKVTQLNKCLKFVAFRGVILDTIQSFLSPRIDLNSRHLFSCDSIGNANR